MQMMSNWPSIVMHVDCDGVLSSAGCIGGGSIILSQPGGATCIPELCEEQRLHWACAPAENVLIESYFGVLTETLNVSGPGVHPPRSAMVAAARHNDVFDVPMLEQDAEAIVAEALRLEADTETRQLLQAHTHKKRRAKHMVVAAYERPTTESG